MARGIDAAVHRGAMPTGTISVIAGGIDIIYPLENRIYPPENRALFTQVVNEGLLPAEMRPSTAPTPRHFPATQPDYRQPSDGRCRD